MKKLIAVFFLLLLLSCNKNEENIPYSQWENPIFVINEGPFQSGTGTVMAFNRTTGEITGDLFEAANGRPLGNIVQSMAVHKDTAWIVVNYSNKVEVVDLEDFKSIWTIYIESPRYVIFKGDSAFISSWNNKIYMYNTENGLEIGEFGTWQGPDEMVISGDFIYSVCSGGWGDENRITYNNINDRNSLWDIEVAYLPSGIVIDKYGMIWVLCSGKGYNGFPDPETDTQGALFTIDPASKQVIAEYQFSSSDIHPNQLVIGDNGTYLYFLMPDGIYKLSVENPALPSSPFIPLPVMMYGLGFDPVEDMIYVSDPIDYIQRGLVYRFNAADGSAVDTIMAGIIPTGFWFNE